MLGDLNLAKVVTIPKEKNSVDMFLNRNLLNKLRQKVSVCLIFTLPEFALLNYTFTIQLETFINIAKEVAFVSSQHLNKLS